MYENKKQKIDQLFENLNKNIFINVSKKRMELDNIKNHYILKNPIVLYEKKKDYLSNLIQKLELVNPLNILKKSQDSCVSRDGDRARKNTSELQPEMQKVGCAAGRALQRQRFKGERVRKK